MKREPISSERSTGSLGTEIGQTRRRMDDILDRLAERLQPRHLLNDVLDFWQVRQSRQGNGHHLGEAIQDNARKVGEVMLAQMRENPVPTLLIGAGIAWLIFGRNEPEEYEEEMPAGEPEDVLEEISASIGAATEPVGRFQPRAGEITGQVRSRGRHLKNRAAEQGEKIRRSAQDVGQQVQARVRQSYEQTEYRVREGYQRAQARFVEATESHPLATGAAFLGIGLLAGFVLPKTEREEEWFGPAASTVRDRVKDAGWDLVERGTRVAKAAAEAAKREAEQQGWEGIQAVAHEAKEAAKETAQKEGITPSSLKQTAEGAAQATGTAPGDAGI